MSGSGSGYTLGSWRAVDKNEEVSDAKRDLCGTLWYEKEPGLANPCGLRKKRTVRGGLAAGEGLEEVGLLASTMASTPHRLHISGLAPTTKPADLVSRFTSFGTIVGGENAVGGLGLDANGSCRAPQEGAKAGD